MPGPATTKGGGMCMATVPDVCKVPAPPAPPIPTPFPNMAQCATANGGTCTTRVKIQNMPALVQGSQIPMSNGDEAGVAGGVVSGTFAQTVTLPMGVPTIQFEGKGVVTLLKQSTHNGSSPNAPMGMQSTPSQTVVIVLK